jgi:hypothetical protein
MHTGTARGGLGRKTGPVNQRARKPVKGTCKICGRHTSNAFVVKGRAYTDAEGRTKRAADTIYHRECYRMQAKGLLSTGPQRAVKDSTGKRCGGCNTIIEAGDKHAHRRGVPYHRECLL